MKALPFNKMCAATKVTVMRIESRPRGWFRKLFRLAAKRDLVTRVLKDRYTGKHGVVDRRPIPWYMRQIEDNEIISYDIEYPSHVNCMMLE